MTQGANTYKKLQIKTASQPQILLMLYEGAMRHVRRAISAIEKKDIKTKAEAIGKVHDIINELLNSLNHEMGGNIALELERLYNFMVDQLIQANLHNTTPPLVHVEKLLKTLHEGWKGAIEKLNKGET